MEAQQPDVMDTQLDAANALLNWLRHSSQARKAGARVHPLLHAARDQYGGLCLKVASMPSYHHHHLGSQTDTSCPQCKAGTNEESWLSEGAGRRRRGRKKDGRRGQEGIAAEEELLAIPRSLMLEPASFEPLSPAHPAGAAEARDGEASLLPHLSEISAGAPAAQDGESILLPAHLPERMPQASLALALLQHYRRQQKSQQQQQQKQSQQQQEQSPQQQSQQKQQSPQQGQDRQQHQQHQEHHQRCTSLCHHNHHQQQQPEQPPELQQKHQKHVDNSSSNTVSWDAPREGQCCAQEQSACLPAAYINCLPSETDLFGILPVLAHLRQQQQIEQQQHEQQQQQQLQRERLEQQQHEQRQQQQQQQQQQRLQHEQRQHEQPQTGSRNFQSQHIAHQATLQSHKQAAPISLILEQATPTARTCTQVAPDGPHSSFSLIAAALAPSPTASAALAAQVERLEEEWQALQAPPFSKNLLQLGLLQPRQERTPAQGPSNLAGSTQVIPRGELSSSCAGSARMEGPLSLEQEAEGVQKRAAQLGINDGSEGVWACRSSGDSSFSCGQGRGRASCLPSLYLWARGLVWSRAIHLWSGPTFVPAIDLLNHAYPPNVRCMVRSEDDVDGAECSVSDEGSCSDDDSSSDSSRSSRSSSSSSVPLGIVTRYTSARQREMFVCNAVHTLPPGSQALWHYNSHSLDAGWLLCYGFLPEDKSSRPDASSTGLNGLDKAIEQLDMAIDHILSGEVSQRAADIEVSPGMLTAVRSLLVREGEARRECQTTSSSPGLLSKDVGSTSP